MNFPELCCTINKLKIKQLNLEKNEDYVVQYINNNTDATIGEDFEKLKKAREQYCNEVKKDVQRNMKFLKNIKSELKNKELANIDIFSLKLDMLNLESTTSILKERLGCNYDNLLKEEMALTIELENIEAKLDDLAKSDSNSRKVSTYSFRQKNSNTLYQGIQEFLQFLYESGGHEGGWDRKDQAVFSNLFHRVKNRKRLMTYLQRNFPEKTTDQLSDHIDWYTTYLSLKNKKKQEIEMWKSEKVKKRKEINSSESFRGRNENIKKSSEHKNLKEKLEKWKEEKQQEIIQKKEMQVQEELKRKDTEKQRQLKNNKLKETILKHKIASEARKQAEELAKEIEELKERERKVQLANKLIPKFQIKDNDYVDKRLAQLKINLTPSGSSTNIGKINGKVKSLRNPERIYKATKQWIARTTAERDEENMFNKFLPLKNIPKLTIPEWKQIEV